MNAIEPDSGTPVLYNATYRDDGEYFWIYAEVTRIIRGTSHTTLEILMPKSKLSAFTQKQREKFR